MNKDLSDLIKVSNYVFERCSRLGYEKLPEPQKVFVCVWELEGQVNNGGFHQYYFNSSGDLALDTEKSLNALGAKHTAQLVKQANTLFGSAGPLPNQNVRQKQLDALGDAKTKQMNQIEKEFFKYKDNLEQLLKAYVSKNVEAFTPN